ncbi:hypothetical protein B0T22DRAFT_458391 [Podospora appendiculata]|uniref:Uncharacterized protein n=1 Tax=Podospora appendiculata TaxID=314037 RepID=A0AAE0X8B3_9PEZI|nr:hypothetical protein B0T22DRAFT_458391 [Podospora appendiculata]
MSLLPSFTLRSLTSPLPRRTRRYPTSLTLLPGVSIKTENSPIGEGTAFNAHRLSYQKAIKMDALRPAEEHDETLYLRVIASPQSATRAERNFIQQLPSPEEEDQMCVAKTGLTLTELVAKALATPDDLTFVEAKIVSLGILHDAFDNVGFDEREKRYDLRYMEPSPLQALQNKAIEAIHQARGEDEKKAGISASKIWTALDKIESDKQYESWRQARAARRLKAGTRWMKTILQGLEEEGAECWGFVVFRTGCYGAGEEGDAAWQRFRDYFDKLAKATVLHWNSGPLLWPKFRAVFVEDEALDSASNEQLRERFREMRDGRNGGDHLPKGIRTSCFLVADRATIKSEAAQAPYVPRYSSNVGQIHIMPEDPVVYIRAVDPDYGVKERPDAEEHVEMTGFQGKATVALPRVFDWLHLVCFNAEHGDGIPGADQRKGWRAIYVQTKAPEAWERNWDPSGGVLYA